MKATGVFATAEEIAELKTLASRAARTPVMALSVADGIAGRGFAATAHKRAQQRCHELALAHGLPEIKGFYGAKLDDGEFVEC